MVVAIERQTARQVELHCPPGLTPYADALHAQRQAFRKRVHAARCPAAQRQTQPDILITLTHPPVYTLGASADERHLLETSSLPVERTERGGDVTYHGPGQLVLYPILNLRHYATDVHWYVRSLEEVVIRTLASLDIAGGRQQGLPGVWVHGAKVCAIGTKLSRWITMHGLALNVEPDLRHFEGIVPCGLHGRSVTSIEHLLPSRRQHLMADVRQQVLGHFADVFRVELVEPSDDLEWPAISLEPGAADDRRSSNFDA